MCGGVVSTKPGQSSAGRTVLALFCAVLLACDGPIVARSPEALYALAREQIAHSSYSPAADTLGRIVREAPTSEPGRRAQVLRPALLGGMARAYKDVAESYLAGHQQATDATYAPEMRSIAMDYFGRARGRSIEMLEALDLLLQEQAAGPWRVDFSLSPVAGGADLLARVRQGQRVDNQELTRAEREEVRQGLAEMLAVFAGAGGDVNLARTRVQGVELEIDPAHFYLGAAQELVQMSSIYGKEALGDRRLFRLYHDRAAALSRRAAELARARGDQKTQEEGERLLRHCQEIAQKR